MGKQRFFIHQFYSGRPRPPPTTNISQFFWIYFFSYSFAHSGSPSLSYRSISPHRKCHDREEWCAKRWPFRKIKLTGSSEISSFTTSQLVGRMLSGGGSKIPRESINPSPRANIFYFVWNIMFFEFFVFEIWKKRTVRVFGFSFFGRRGGGSSVFFAMCCSTVPSNVTIRAPPNIRTRWGYKKRYMTEFGTSRQKGSRCS